MLRITKKDGVMFSKYALLILLALQIICCESVDSAVVPRNMPQQRAEYGGRNNRMHARRDMRVKSTTLVATREVKKEVKIVAVAAEPEVTLNAFDLCLCGAFATAFGDFVMHPVDTIKVSQQVTNTVFDFPL